MSESSSEFDTPLSIDGQVATLTLSGELTISTVDDLKDEIFMALNCPEIRIDLQGIHEIDTCGLQLLLVLAHQAQLQGKQCSLSRSSPLAEDLLRLFALSLPPTPSPEVAP